MLNSAASTMPRIVTANAVFLPSNRKRFLALSGAVCSASSGAAFLPSGAVSPAPSGAASELSVSDSAEIPADQASRNVVVTVDRIRMTSAAAPSPAAARTFAILLSPV